MSVLTFSLLFEIQLSHHALLIEKQTNKTKDYTYSDQLRVKG